MAEPSPRTLLRWTLTILATAAVMLGLDLAWLGILAADFYAQALGPLRREPVYWPAALLFYALYVAATVGLAVVPAQHSRGAAGRGALLGLVAYATYELTNWAVLRDWPALLVPVDILWGMGLTATTAAAGHRAWSLQPSGKR
jgi:uncharacterized membrane protein